MPPVRIIPRPVYGAAARVLLAAGSAGARLLGRSGVTTDDGILGDGLKYFNDRLIDEAAEKITTEDALSYPVFSRCVSLIAATIAQLITSTLRVVDENGAEPQGRTAEAIRARRILELLKGRPDRVEGAYAFWSRVAFDVLTEGNCLLEVVGSSPVNPARLRRLDPTFAYPYRSNGVLSWDVRGITWWGLGGYLGGNAYTRGTVHQPVRSLDSGRVIHVRWHTPRASRSMLGASPVKKLARTIAIGIFSDRFILAFWRMGPLAAFWARMVFRLQNRNAPPPKVVDEFLAKVMESGKPAVMPEGLDMDTLDAQPSDSRLSNLRELQIREVGREFGIPAPILGENVTQWGTGIEHLSRLKWRDGIKQHVEAILFPLGDRLLPAGLRFDIDESDIVRGDTVALAKLLEILSKIAGVSVREARRMLGLPAEMDGEPVKPPAPSPAPGPGDGPWEPMDPDDPGVSQ